METAMLCKKYQGQGVVGFDIACSGDKDGELLKHFADAYKVRTNEPMLTCRTSLRTFR